MKIKKVINISDRVLTIDNIKLKPKEDHIWREDFFTERLITRLRILENLKFVRVLIMMKMILVIIHIYLKNQNLKLI